MPDELVGGGDRLAISVDKTVLRFKVHRLPGNLKSEDHGAVLNWLIERKCRRQANDLIDLLHSGLVE